MEPVTITTFYHFTPLDEPSAFKPLLLARMQALGIRGTVTLASEGINATISGAAEAIKAFHEFLTHTCGITAPMLRTSHFTAQPFKRTKVKVKRELISLGVPSQPSVCVGEYVMPKDWNALITSPNVVTIDTRNNYEFQLGHFKGAMNPATRNFKEMVAFTQAQLTADQTIAMYCTGGIRCEKYSSYLLAQGFSNVYHLKGGILAYLEAIPPQESLWQGSCFVFDERVAVGHGLKVAA